ncbi:MAG: ankyrin repeat domain-containing protein [Cyclobacteriaceae bacterium]
MKSKWLFVITILLFFSCKTSQNKSSTISAFSLHELILDNKANKIRKYFDAGNHQTYLIEGWGPLLFAVEAGHTEIVQILIDNKFDVNVASIKNGTFPLQRAASNGFDEIVNILIMNGADVDQQDTERRATALMFASVNGHESVVKLLLSNDALINVRGTRGESALFLAVSAQHIDVVELLLSYGANKTRPDIYGKTCMQKATELKNEELINLLKD